MKFADRLRVRRHGPRRRIAICVSGTASQWDNLNPWWEKLGEDIVVFGHVWGKLTERPKTMLARLEEHEPFDALALVSDRMESKLVYWEKASLLCDEHEALAAYGMMRVSMMKRRFEMARDREFDVCVFTTPNNAHEGVIHVPHRQSLHVRHEKFPEAFARKVSLDFFYAESAAFDKACLFFRHLSIIKRSVFDPGWLTFKHAFPDRLPIELSFYFHLRMLHLKLASA